MVITAVFDTADEGSIPSTTTRTYGVTVSTVGSEPADRGSIPCMFSIKNR
jgi:hypothetical protein